MTKETKKYYDVYTAPIYMAQNIVRIPNIITIRPASGTKSVSPAPPGAAYSLTLYWSVDKPSRVFAHRSLGCHQLNVREDLGREDHPQLKILQFHQYPASQMQEVELFDDYDVLRQGGTDGGFPPAEDELGPGPTLESTDSSSLDPADIPVPDDGTDFDIDDGAFWVEWLKEIEADEYEFTEVFHTRHRD